MLLHVFLEQSWNQPIPKDLQQRSKNRNNRTHSSYQVAEQSPLNKFSFAIIISINQNTLTGTQAIYVGLSKLASPCCPFLMAVETSVRVLGLEYPTIQPAYIHVISAHNSNMCASGRYPIYVSPALQI